MSALQLGSGVSGKVGPGRTPVPAATTDWTLELQSSSDDRQILGILFLSDHPLVLEFTRDHTSAGKLKLVPNEPYIWDIYSDAPCPFDGDFDTLHVTNPDDSLAQLEWEYFLG